MLRPQSNLWQVLRGVTLSVAKAKHRDRLRFGIFVLQELLNDILDIVFEE